MAAKYGTTACSLCGCEVSVKPMTVASAYLNGYDADFDGEYLTGRCNVCAGRKAIVYLLDVNCPTPALDRYFEEFVAINQAAPDDSCLRCEHRVGCASNPLPEDCPKIERSAR